jgi:hypothetical protein
MTFDPNPYRNTLVALTDQLKYVWQERGRDGITLACIAGHIPLLAMLAHVLQPEILGEIPELVQMKNELLIFYKYDEIAPWKSVD